MKIVVVGALLFSILLFGCVGDQSSSSNEVELPSLVSMSEAEKQYLAEQLSSLNSDLQKIREQLISAVG
ncbi:hypothetical protein AUJ15_02025 [Candidatus Micrarchaeota archaeon CG1_02_55_41]|nr:MAG: hypothetical protein AUJ15_02025 [Candidatus Micrarchaeota archaeon CG1_02_55_41]